MLARHSFRNRINDSADRSILTFRRNNAPHVDLPTFPVAAYDLRRRIAALSGAPRESVQQARRVPALLLDYARAVETVASSSRKT